MVRHREKGKGRAARPEAKRSTIPAWAQEPLTQFLDSISSTHDFYHLTIDGLESLIHHHKVLTLGHARIRELRSKLIEAGGKLAETEETLAEEKKRALVRERSKERAELAEREVSNGFPVLCSQQIVSLWSSIECFVEDVLVAWLTNDAGFIRGERIRKIKIPIADFHRMSETERKYFLVSELQRDPTFSQRNEFEKFECLLALAGLSSDIDPDVKRALIELGHFRNVLLHRRGIADPRFVQACPWLRTRVGERAEINSASAERYTGATISYYELIVCRMKVLFKNSVDGAKESA